MNVARIETWNPEAGSTVNAFLNGINFLDEQGRKQVLDEGKKILGRCSNPADKVSGRCLLVLGEVQSGKTLSFSTVVALTRDNKIPVTVILAGTKKPLLRQTHAQLLKDFNIDDSGNIPQWFVSTSNSEDVRNSAVKAIESWENPIIPSEFRQSVVLIAMKTPAGIRKVTKLLKDIQLELGKSFPTLIIDDEGDEASLNTLVKEGGFSATYSRISELRRILPNHSFLSYTATPEAPLLLALEDHLSPESVIVLTPGETYIGGYRLFVDRSSKFPIEIPAADIPVSTNPGAHDSPPPSLSESIAYFLLALTISHKRGNPEKPLSMLIHPATGVDTHDKYRVWVKAIIDKWKLHFQDFDPNNSSYLMPIEFRNAFAELKRTIDAEALEILLETTHPEVELMNFARYWITSGRVEVRVVNSDRAANNITPNDWKTKDGWIVIGGSKLSRGFVVRNLAVTFMPRGGGVGNVDTIQQRGRFFGHKKSYLDLLRGWFSSDMIDAYASIVETERALRDSLKQYDNKNLPLKEWRREFMTSPVLRLTRQNVISLNNSDLDLTGNSWFEQKQLFDPALVIGTEYILESVKKLMATAIPTSLDNRNDPHKHLYIPLSFKEVINLLLDWPISASDRVELDAHLTYFNYLAQTEANTNATIYFMDQLEPKRRSADKASMATAASRKYWKTISLHEGPRSKYIGDRNVRSDDSISIQIHKVIPREDASDKQTAEVLALAISFPKGFEKRITLQT
jgi:Z1 domain